MNAIVTKSEALRKLYKKLVGSDSKHQNPTKIINELAENYSGGGGGGSDSVFVTTIVNNDGVFTLGSKWSEVYAAMENGKACFANGGADSLQMSYFIVECYGDESENYYRVTASGLGSALELETDSQDGYPSKTVD